MNATACSEDAAMFSIPFPGNYLFIVVLIFLSALFSGLTLGLLSLDKIGLQIVIGGDDAEAAHYARAILPVRENGNLLLCTLLLGNVAVNALLMADMTSGLVGFLGSTILIVIFGEIIPQASCSRHPLMIGYYSLPLVKTFILMLCVIAYPLGILLDAVLGTVRCMVFVDYLCGDCGFYGDSMVTRMVPYYSLTTQGCLLYIYDLHGL